MSVISELLYLIESNQKNCKKLLSKHNRSPNDIIDFLISLHLVLEAGLNGLFREIIINKTKKTINKTEIAKNLDCITFIDKTILFIYMEEYDLKDKISEADGCHSIIGILKDFSNTRNKLIHGSMVGSFSDGNSDRTLTANLITPEHMKKQIEKFEKILKGVTFYLDHLKSCPVNKNDLKNKFLDITFLRVGSGL